MSPSSFRQTVCMQYSWLVFPTWHLPGGLLLLLDTREPAHSLPLSLSLHRPRHPYWWLLTLPFISSCQGYIFFLFPSISTVCKTCHIYSDWFDSSILLLYLFPKKKIFISLFTSISHLCCRGRLPRFAVLIFNFPCCLMPVETPTFPVFLSCFSINIRFSSHLFDSLAPALPTCLHLLS